MTPSPAAIGGDSASTRIDKWLWQARMFKTRTIAAKFVSDGHVRISRGETTARVEKPSALVRPGDALVFNRGERLFVLRVVACGERRGPASEARLLYEDLSPPPPEKGAIPPQPFAREKGAGRPTKKDRRAIDTLKTG